MLENILIVAGGYLIGSIPFGVVVVRLFRGEDIRKQGSGNIGASNVWRVYGRWLGVPVALLDVAKGFVPALVGVKLGGEWVGVLAGAAAMLGHARPIWLGFSKGGKMVATAGGVVLALAPLAAGICLARLARHVRALPLRVTRIPRHGGGAADPLPAARRAVGDGDLRHRREPRRDRAPPAEHRPPPARHRVPFRARAGSSASQLYALSQSASVVCRSPSVPVISERSSPTVPHRSASTS